jgi:hypothetical protein
MTEMEYRTFGELYKILDADQRRQGAQRVLTQLSGLLMKKNWDE